jgi:AcrR family transcriptional regulator
VHSPDTSIAPSLRERKKAQTRHAIQQEALRLFLSKGYEATTVEEIAAAASVSHMTFFRYFPRKEDVVLADEYDPLIVELLAARPTSEPAVEKIRHALKEGLSRVYAADRDALLVRTRLILSTPALRARLWEQQAATEHLIARTLVDRPGQERDDLRRHHSHRHVG